MKILLKIINILAIALPSLRIFLKLRIAAIALFYIAVIAIYAVYIQSIGSGIGIFSGLFHVTLISQSIDTFCYLVGALFLMTPPDTVYPALMLFSSLPCVPGEDKPARLTEAERAAFTLPEHLKQILVGLNLGDLYSRMRAENCHLICFQGLVHEDYLHHLYSLFKPYCLSGPKITTPLPNKRTGKVYPFIRFNTLSLQCFNELHNLFHLDGKKIVPPNIGALLTPLSLAYWIADDGSFHKRDRALVLNTQCFSFAEVELLVEVLTNKFGLKCTINKDRSYFVIRISAKSIKDLQALLGPIMPSMMKHKIGL